MLRPDFREPRKPGRDADKKTLSRATLSNVKELERKIRTYVRKCAKGQVSPRVGELAAHLGMSERALRERCRKILQTSPKMILLDEQLEIADEHLRGSSTSEVAYKAGFGTRTTFFRAHKKIRGSTPRGSTQNQDYQKCRK
jgi:AraC-like DNA-binding protein